MFSNSTSTWTQTPGSKLISIVERGRFVLAVRLQMRVLITVCALFLCGKCLWAQQTVFNVPNGDVLERGKVYAELDITYKHSDDSATFTPRVVVGIGHRIEIGLNVNGIGIPTDLQTTLTPTIKWKIFDGSKSGWVFLVGDGMSIPVQNKSYDVGNYLWAEWTKTWKTKTRATFGAYYFTPNVVSSAQRAGGQFAIEQPLGSRFALAADWYTGDQSLGYVTPGVVVKITKKLTWYGTYQFGNSEFSSGNHQFLTELGWNFN